jgi:hypothetical protein
LCFKVDKGDSMTKRSIQRVFAICITFGVALSAGAARRLETMVQVSVGAPQTQEQKVRAQVFDFPDESALRPGMTRHANFGSTAPVIESPDYAAFLKDAVCGADAVVVGTALSSQSFLTVSGSSIFTDYQIADDTWIKPASRPGSGRPRIDSSLTVSLVGGVVGTGAGQMTVVAQPPLDLGVRYLLFLRLIPTTESYRLAAPVFDLAGRAPVQRGRRALPRPMENGEATVQKLLADLRQAAHNCRFSQEAR